MSYQVGGNQIGTQVYLNVYDLQPNANKMCSMFGLGFYHTGIHIGLSEYTFAGHNGTHTGVVEVTPKTNTPNFKEAILLGKTTKSMREIMKILDNLKEAFPGNSYHIARKNCNSFSNAFAQALLGKGIPGQINRMASIGSFLMDIDDFIRMKPYDSKFETVRKVQSTTQSNVFSKYKGTMIG